MSHARPLPAACCPLTRHLAMKTETNHDPPVDITINRSQLRLETSFRFGCSLCAGSELDNRCVVGEVPSNFCFQRRQLGVDRGKSLTERGPVSAVCLIVACDDAKAVC